MIVERAKAAAFSTIGGTVKPPDEWAEFRFCRAFHCLPHQIDGMDEDEFRLYLEFMGIEQEAARIRGIPLTDA